MVITIAIHQKVHAASSSSGVVTIQGGSIQLSSGTTQNITTNSASNNLKHDTTQTCFNITQTIRKTGTKTNTFSVFAQIQFFCQEYRNGGGISITNTILCPGVGSQDVSRYTPFPSGITQGSQTWTYLAEFTGYCEICTNHQPTAFPLFTVATSTFASTLTPRAGLPVANPSSYIISVDGTSNPVTTGFANSPNYRLPYQA